MAGQNVLWDMPMGTLESLQSDAKDQLKNAKEQKERAAKIVGIRDRRVTFIDMFLAIERLKQMSLDAPDKNFVLVDVGSGLTTYANSDWEKMDELTKFDGIVYASAKDGRMAWAGETA